MLPLWGISPVKLVNQGNSFRTQYYSLLQISRLTVNGSSQKISIDSQHTEKAANRQDILTDPL